MELVGIDSEVEDQIYKLASASLCSSLSGQIMTRYDYAHILLL